MTITRDSELLSPGIEKTLEGIEQLNAAIDARIKNVGEWKEDHLRELVILHGKLTLIKMELSILRQMTR